MIRELENIRKTWGETEKIPKYRVRWRAMVEILCLYKGQGGLSYGPKQTWAWNLRDPIRYRLVTFWFWMVSFGISLGCVEMAWARAERENEKSSSLCIDNVSSSNKTAITLLNLSLKKTGIAAYHSVKKSSTIWWMRCGLGRTPSFDDLGMAED